MPCLFFFIQNIMGSLRPKYFFSKSLSFTLSNEI